MIVVYGYNAARHALGVALHSGSGGLCRDPFFGPSQTIVCVEGTDLFDHLWRFIQRPASNLLRKTSFSKFRSCSLALRRSGTAFAAQSGCASAKSLLYFPGHFNISSNRLSIAGCIGNTGTFLRSSSKWKSRICKMIFVFPAPIL